MFAGAFDTSAMTNILAARARDVGIVAEAVP